MKSNRYMDTIRAQERLNQWENRKEFIGELFGGFALFALLFALYFILYALGF